MTFRELLKCVPILIVFALLTNASALAEGDFDPVRDILVATSIEPSPTPVGGSGQLTVQIALPPNTHITSVENGFFFVTPDSIQGVEWGLASFPTGTTLDGETVYKGKIDVVLPFTIASSLKDGDRIDFNGLLGYQTCTEVEPVYCTPPIERSFTASITVGGNAVTSPPSDDAATGGLSLEERAKRALNSGSAVAMLWIFIGGVLLSFTPCVYPIIPITIAFIGGRAGGSRLKGFTLSLVFVLGLGLVYATLGLVAAVSGGVFGLSTQNPLVIGFVAVVFLVMGNGMMGAFELSLPSALQTALNSKKRSGYLGALFVGATTGLVAVPCVGPVLVALLSWVATTGKVVIGMVYLFVFASGLGLLFVVIGTIAGALIALPKAGGWMEKVKHFFGFVLIATAYYYAYPLVPKDWFVLAVGFGFLATAGVFGAFTRQAEGAEFVARTTKAIATFLLIAGVFYTWLGLAKLQGLTSAMTGGMIATAPASQQDGHIASGVNWLHISPDEGFAQAKASGKPMMIDFWAEWCVACKELDHKTFSDPSVSPIINDKFIAVKVDGTKITPELKAVWARYGVKGLPTVVFFTPDGVEIERFEAFRTVEQVMPVLDRVLRSAK